MLFRQIGDAQLAQYAYLVGCQQTKEALIIDPEPDIDRYVAAADAEDLKITAVAETHIHADFLSGSREFVERYGVTAYLSDEGDADWKYEGPSTVRSDVRLLKHGDTFSIGRIEIKAVHSPGHTPEHLSYLVTDRGGAANEPIGLASGDFVFVGDLGRPDLLESAAGHVGVMELSARALYRSVQDFLALPDYVQIWPGHGAGSACGKALGAVPASTVGYERRFNPAIEATTGGEDAFVRSILEGQPEPPLYFARMKQLNKVGPPLLGALPEPAELGTADLGALAGRQDSVVLDTRQDRAAFMAGHLPGSLYVPLDRTFPTVAGSFLDPDVPVYLLADRRLVPEAVKALIRIGLDRIVGFAAPERLKEYAAGGGVLQSTETIDFGRLLQIRGKPGMLVLDVRNRSEYDVSHVPDALNIAHTRLVARRGEIPGNTTLAIHCASGARAAVSAALMERFGHRVLYVDDDFERWTTDSEASTVDSVS